MSIYVKFTPPRDHRAYSLAHSVVAQAPQRSKIERSQHRHHVIPQNSFFLPRRRRVGVADTSHDGRDMPILAIERRAAALRVIPGQGR